MNDYANEVIGVTGISKCFPSSSKNFKQFQVHFVLEIPLEKPDIEQILHDNIDIQIFSSYIIETPNSVSNEGQRITGRKLIINGVINEKLEYIAKNHIQSVHAAEFATNFTTFIVLDSFSSSLSYKINPYVEDVFIKQLNGRKIFKNVMLFLDAMPIDAELLNYDNEEFGCINQSKKNFEQMHDCSCTTYCKKYFSQFCSEEIIEIQKDKADIEQVVSIIVDPEIISVRFISTAKGISAEGQILTGKKAVVEIKFKQKIMYAADMPNQSLHAAETTYYESAYVVLPCLFQGTELENLYKMNLIVPKLIIEDLSYSKLDNRRIFKNICMLLEFRFIPTYEICYSSYDNCTKSDLFLCHADGSKQTPLTHSECVKNIKPNWAPNGQQIGYLSGTDGAYKLYVCNVKNNSRNMLLPPNAFDTISSFSWLKSNYQVIFSAVKGCSKELYLFDMINNNCQQITQGNGMIRSYYPKVSPDGLHVAYLRTSTYRIDLWYSDLSGKSQYKLTNTGAVRDYDWLSCSEGFVYIDNKNESSCEIYMLKFDEHLPSCIVKCDSWYGCKYLSVSPDGCYVAFVATNKCSDDIYVFDMHTRELHNITGNKENIKIISIVWNTDSSEIFYASKDFMYYDIYSVSIISMYKKHLANTHASNAQLSYRPKIR